MYVPFEQAIRILASGRPNEEVSATLMREEADFSTSLEMTVGVSAERTVSEHAASASGVGQLFFDLFSGEKKFVREGTADAST